MEPSPRNRIVSAISIRKLNELVKELQKEGWQPVGEIALAEPDRDTNPPYFWQAVRLENPKRARSERVN
jgi:hypothetical protein